MADATGTHAKPLGLRERKKLATRRRIAETAAGLFGERGFERVPVAEIARVADVSEQTVFNYFPTKEDLVYWRLGSFEDELLQAIRARAPGEPVLAAFRRFILGRDGLMAEDDPEALERLASFARMIERSPALRAREDQILSGYTRSLGALIAEETGAEPGDLRPWVAANAMIGAHRALIEHTRRRAVAGDLGPGLAAEVRAEAERAFALLEDGMSALAPGRA